MTAAITILAQHVPQIRGYVAPPTSGASAPAVAPSPAPPPAGVAPTVFTVLAVSPIDFTMSTAISPARTLATITTAVTSILVDASLTIPGCAVNVVGSPVTSITLSGTPTTAGDYRLVLTYLKNDGTSTVLGSSTHQIAVIDNTILFVAGSCTSLTARNGQYVDTVLCSPTIARNVDVVISVNNYVQTEPQNFQGYTSTNGLVWAWTPGGSSSGTLRVKGVLASPLGGISLLVTYLEALTGRVLGTSGHTITVVSASTPPPSPPAPAPAPTPPTPAPAPSPAAAPAPGAQPPADAHWASVLALYRFDSGAFGDRYAAIPTILGASFTNAKTAAAGLGGWAQSDAGASGLAAYFNGGAGLHEAVPSSWDASSGDLTVECYVRDDNTSGLYWSGTVGGPTAGTLLCPVVSMLMPDGALVWVLGFLSKWIGGRGRVVYPFFSQETRGTDRANPNAPMWVIGQELTSRSGRFTHLSGMWDRGAAVKQGVWYGGAGGNTAESYGLPGTGLPMPAGGFLQVGGSCPAPNIALTGGPTITGIAPLYGAVDELRLAKAARNTFSGSTTVAITDAARGIPWPNY